MHGKLGTVMQTVSISLANLFYRKSVLNTNVFRRQKNYQFTVQFPRYK